MADHTLPVESEAAFGGLGDPGDFEVLVGNENADVRSVDDVADERFRAEGRPLGELLPIRSVGPAGSP